MEETNDCIFKDILTVCSTDKVYEENELTESRREKIDICSKLRKDNFTEQVSDTNKKYHKQCYIYYTSTQKIKRHLAKTSESASKQPAVKRKRYIYLYILYL